MSGEMSNINPVPIQKTLLLMNNFLMNTATFLNNFSNTCEKKLAKISGKLAELEIVLVVLEEKLNSIPDVSNSAPTPAAPASIPTPQTASVEIDE